MIKKYKALVHIYNVTSILYDKYVGRNFREQRTGNPAQASRKTESGVPGKRNFRDEDFVELINARNNG